MQKQPTVHLLVVDRQDGPVYYAKWRDDGQQVKRKIGPAWIERGDSSSAERRRTRHDGWIKRRGRVPDGHYTEDAALAAIPGTVSAYRDEKARKGEQEAAEAARVVTLDEIASAWLDHRVTVGGIKRTTRKDYAAMLRRPDDAPKKRGRKPKARIMSTFGGREAASIHTPEVARWLAELDRDPDLGPRAVNKHRGVLLGIYAYACRSDTFGLTENPVEGTEKRREPDQAEIITYTPAEVEAIALAARGGAHRVSRSVRVSRDEAAVIEQEDEQDACIILVAAYCGLRLGELLGLRWRHIGWDAARLHVQRSYALGQEDSPKGRRKRTVPIAEQPLQALARLSQRPMFTGPGDLVFCSRTGEHLSKSALRRR